MTNNKQTKLQAKLKKIEQTIANLHGLLEGEVLKNNLKPLLEKQSAIQSQLNQLMSDTDKNEDNNEDNNNVAKVKVKDTKVDKITHKSFSYQTSLPSITQTGSLFNQVVSIYIGLPTPTISEADYRQALNQYLKHILTTYHTLNLRGIRADQAITIELEAIYITLSTLEVTQNISDKSNPRSLKRQNNLKGNRTRPIQALLGQQKRLVVLGNPGSGKTTLLAYIALTCARALLEENPALTIERLGLNTNDIPLPIFIPLREFAAYIRQLPSQERAGGASPNFLLTYLTNYFRRWELYLPPDFFQAHLKVGQCLLLFDGLDEVADHAERTSISEHITGFVQRFPKNRFVLSSRLRGYAGAAQLREGFKATTILDFNKADIKRFITTWTLAVEIAAAGGIVTPGVRSQAVYQANDLEQAIFSNERVQVLATNPLLLTVIALIHRYRAKLPEDRAELYNECTEVLLGYWETGKPGEESKRLARYTGTELAMDASEKRAFIEPLAFAMHQAGHREVDKDEILQQLTTQFAERDYPPNRAKIMAAKFLEALVLRSGLLRESDMGIYQFLHLTFQEYLTARLLADRTDFAQYATAKAGDAWWKEVILLTAGHLAAGGRQRVSALINHLLQATQPNYVGILLAGECLLDVRQHRVEANVWRATQQALVNMLDSASTAQLNQRVSAGRILGIMGDPRPGVTTLPPELTPPLSGEFLYGKHKQKCTIDPFQASIYLITNAQYAQFIQADGYNTQKWWSKAGWQWRQHGHPFFGWQQMDHPDYWHNRLWNNPNHPVIGITYYEAEAFCLWLSDTYNRSYHLPTEEQWERLARGQKGLEYPWGNRWRANIANTIESGLNSTTAVGIFPSEVSQAGVYDCAGNVREWCASWANADKTTRILRGGSWCDDQLSAHTLVRFNSYYPYDSDDIIGFRVVSPVNE